MERCDSKTHEKMEKMMSPAKMRASRLKALMLSKKVKK